MGAHVLKKCFLTSWKKLNKVFQVRVIILCNYFGEKLVLLGDAHALGHSPPPPIKD